MHNVEIFIAMNEDGTYEVANTQEDATERLIDNDGGQMIRVAKINVLMSAPRVDEVEGDVIVPDTSGETTAIAAE